MPRGADAQPVALLLDGFLDRGDAVPLTRLLVAQSRLPGPRANLELGDAFATAAAAHTGPAMRRLWRLCDTLAGIGATAAPTNTPEEFLAFCGTLGLGAIGAAAPEFSGKALTRLHVLVRDARGRTREAVARGLQRMIGAHPRETLAALSGWITKDDWLAMRAVAAAVAEPALLKNRPVARVALRLHQTILRRVLRTRARTSEAFRTLRQALGYSCSVVTAALPGEGFAFMRTLAESGDPDGRWIVEENLKKKRLTAVYPQEAASLERLLARRPQ